MPKKRSPGDGGLYYIPSRKLWRATIELGTDPLTGKRIQKQIHSKTQRGARDKADALRAEIAEHGAPLDRTTTLTRWAPTWLAARKPNIDPATWTTYASLINRHILPTIGHKKIASIRASDVIAVRTAITAKGLSTSTAKQAHTVLSMLLDAARIEKLTPTNAAADVEAPGGRRTKIVATTRGAFTTEQSIAILAEAAKTDLAEGSRWWFKIMTGARQTEVLGATRQDLADDLRYYVVNWKLEELTREHGCGDTCGRKRGVDCTNARWRVPDDFEMHQVHGRWHLTRPKSQVGRVIPLIPQMRQVLARHLEATADLPNPMGLIWHDGAGRPIEPRDDAQQWRMLLHRAGIITADEARPGGTAMTGHWARHTAITILMELTHGDAQLVGEIVGHSTAEVTAIYRHARIEEREGAMEALGRAWADKLPEIGPAPGRDE